MCLVAFSWKVHPDFPLLISANRDEFFDRPAAPMHRWESGIYAGKDLRGGGTWLGFHPNGKWALLTNFRDFTQQRSFQTSRGSLVLDFLQSNISPENYLDRIAQTKDQYDGFNLLCSDGEKLLYYSNHGPDPTEVPAGIHALSNNLLDAPWPKTELAKSQMEGINLETADSNSLLSILKSPDTYPLELLPKTGLNDEMERSVSAQFIRMTPNYGTVSSTSVLRNISGHTQLKERSFDWDAEKYRDVSFNFQT